MMSEKIRTKPSPKLLNHTNKIASRTFIEKRATIDFAFEPRPQQITKELHCVQY